MVADFLSYKSQLRTDYLPPSNLEAEESILGGILLDPSAFPRVNNILEPKHFYVTDHQLLYRRIAELFNSRKVTDFLSVKSYLEDKNEFEKVGGINKFTQLTNRVFSTVQIDVDATLLVQKSVQRQTIELANNLINFSQGYQSDDLIDWYQDQNIDPKNLLDQPSLFLGIIEEQVHALTRGRYRGSLNKDSDVVTVDRLIQRIKDIENNFEKLEYKRFKLTRLAKEYKLSEKQLESIYLCSLLSDNNTPIQTLAQLRAQYGDNINEWFIHGMLPKGAVVLLHALGGVGKTRLAYDFCYSMATGSSWGSQFPVTAPSRRCLIVQTDESTNDMIRSLNARGFNDDHDIYIKTKWSFDNMASLRREIIENKIEVVVLDSLTALNRNAIVSENDTEYARPILQLKDLAQELGISILLIHHSNSEGKSRGTKAIHNSVSQVLSLKFPSPDSKPSTKDRLLIIEKSRFRRPTEYKLSFECDYETGQWSWICEGENKEADAAGTLKDQIVEFLKNQRNQLFSAHQICEVIGGAYNSIRRALFELSELDQIISRVRSHTKGRPWLHYLKWEILSDHDFPLTDHLSDHDQLVISNDDQKGFAHNAGFGVSDHDHAKNHQKSHKKNRKNDDQMISKGTPSAQTGISNGLDPVIVTDHLTDHVTDHDQERSVREEKVKKGLSSKRQRRRQRSLSKKTQSTPTVDRQPKKSESTSNGSTSISTGDRHPQKSDPTPNESKLNSTRDPQPKKSESSSNESNSNDDLNSTFENSASGHEGETQKIVLNGGQGIPVRYVGNDKHLKQTISKAKNLRLLSIGEDGLATIKADSWAIERKVPFEHLSDV